MLPRKRDRPRRNEGRVQHNRMKPKASAPSSAAERRHLNRVSDGPCVSCGTTQNIVLHHIMKCPGKCKRRDDRFVARLCATCHNMGTKSVHLLGSEEKFRRERGVDLVAWAIEQWRISEDIEAGGVATSAAWPD